MLTLKYTGQEAIHNVEFSRISGNVVQLLGDLPFSDTGFTLSREGKNDNWAYPEYTTLYRQVEGGLQFSDNGSIYVEPTLPDPVPEKPYIPTLEEVKAAKKQEIYATYNVDVVAGVDVELSTGTQRFPLTAEDREFLFGKQIELSGSNAETVSYQDSNNHCITLPREDMQKIITAAFAYVNFKTTYRNNLYEWVDGCITKEDVEQIVYGMDIPEEHQSVSFKMYLAQQEGE